jgi:hypothetical protein
MEFVQTVAFPGNLGYQTQQRGMYLLVESVKAPLTKMAAQVLFQVLNLGFKICKCS